MKQNQTALKNSNRQTPEEPSTDWLAWFLQLAVGFVVGCGVGYQIWRLAFRGSLNEMLLVAAAGGLICGAFTSFHGNRAWMAGSIFLAPEPSPPRKARACSLIIGGAGVVTVLLTLIRHLIAATTQEHGSASNPFDVVPLLLAIVPGFFVFHAIRTGSGLWSLGIIHREQTPLFFWVYVLLNGIAALTMLSMAL